MSCSQMSGYIFIKSFQRPCFDSGLCNGMKNMILIQVFKECIFKHKRSWMHMPNMSFPNVHDLFQNSTSKNVGPLFS